MHVITLAKIGGKAMQVNDQDDRYLLHKSKAHALRVIKWLGLTGAKVREATEEEAANGHVDIIKSRARC